MTETEKIKAHPYSEDEQIVAVVLEDGEVHDGVYNVETGLVFANDGYRVVATRDIVSRITGNVHFTAQEQQDMYDKELALALDCFGEDHLK